MWERIRNHLNSLQFETNIDSIAEDIVDFLSDTGLSEETQYEIEMALYGIMDNTTAPKAFIKKAGKLIKKKVDEHTIKIFEESAEYYNDDEFLGDQYDGVEFD
jgi:hypothetical protein